MSSSLTSLVPSDVKTLSEFGNFREHSNPNIAVDLQSKNLHTSSEFFFLQPVYSLSMVTLVTIFGLLGNITTGLVYLSPAKTFWHIVQRGSTEEFDSLPYVVKLLNGYMWVYYGLVKPNSILVATINGFGAVLELIYVIIFLILAPPRMRVITAILFGILDVVFPVAVVLISQLSFNREMQINISGFLSLLFSVATYGSPLSIMKTVVTTKSVEYMPFLLSFILFINGLTWTVYAVLTRDWFIGIPNGSGFVLGTAQLVLYAMYWKPKQPKRTSDNVEDDWQHEHLIADSGPSLKNNESRADA
ncbi:Nodulin MtN3 family protein isoform 1 [Theobroma cacao]|uniref:Bidirectional sugar transporter SWEET n=1 Tax=Theobroma cacao TaxID=3641 RepID=A0A061F4B5_THECC|nr:Nodulin MtN3 family protein isoform 1 [Theobroma cacao]